ncbi:UPAR/Ly6 domain-containing protein qvr-like [Tubulanus polymorphus]|uniref:UPAR/Ly6 domain-containing protein qvr-like n=1 Tax=Tubulanus polymorphus TaxID=672921 RepID=UPI003DA5A8BB
MTSFSISSSITAIFVVFMLMPSGSFQQEYGGDIDCFKCEGLAGNSTCSSFENSTTSDEIFLKTCRGGVCVKWTHYREGRLILERTCSNDLNLNLLLSEGCRRERSGNGYLCMCGSHSCNGSPPKISAAWLTSTVTISVLLSWVLLP